MVLIDSVEAIEESVKQWFLESLEEFYDFDGREMLQEVSQRVNKLLIPFILVDLHLNKPIENFYEFSDLFACGIYAVIYALVLQFLLLALEIRFSLLNS